MNKEKENLEKIVAHSSQLLLLAEKLEANTTSRIEAGLSIVEREKNNLFEVIKISINFFGVFATIFTIVFSIPQLNNHNQKEVLFLSAFLALFFLITSFIAFFHFIPKKNKLISRYDLIILQTSETKDHLRKVITGNIELTQKVIDLHLKEFENKTE
jgi:hypothetical protein